MIFSSLNLYLIRTRIYGPLALHRLQWDQIFSNGILKLKFQFQLCSIYPPTCLHAEKVWKSGQFWEGYIKVYYNLANLTRRLKKYEYLANFDKETKKNENLGAWGARRFSHISIFLLSFVKGIFSMFQIFIIFLLRSQNSYPHIRIIDVSV